jgi:hypothetical protein
LRSGRTGFLFLSIVVASSIQSPLMAGAKHTTLKQIYRQWERLTQDSSRTDTAAQTALEDTIAATGAQKGDGATDSAHKKVLLLTGDSMIDCLGWTISPIGAQLGYDVRIASFIATTTSIWAKRQYMTRLIKKHHPSFIIFCLGSNEYYLEPGTVRNRAGYVKTIVAEADSISVPMVWIGPPDLETVKELDRVIGGVIGSGRYFPSSDLVLDRQRDNRHPSIRASAVWSDTVCRWIQNSSDYKLRLLPAKAAAGSIYVRKNYAAVAQVRIDAMRDSLAKARADSLAFAKGLHSLPFWQLQRALLYHGPVPF